VSTRFDAPFDFGSEARTFDEVEVVVSPAAAAISGKVFDAAGEVRTDSAVVLFSSDSSRWYRQSQGLRLERPSLGGEFRMGSLPPGSYYVVALSDVSDIVTSGDWQDPATLDKLRSIASEVSVNESETRSVTLRLGWGNDRKASFRIPNTPRYRGVRGCRSLGDFVRSDTPWRRVQHLEDRIAHCRRLMACAREFCRRQHDHAARAVAGHAGLVHGQRPGIQRRRRGKLFSVRL
jgi:hypothetical protein